MATTGQINAVSASQYGDDILVWTNINNIPGASGTSYGFVSTDPETAPDPGNTLTLLFQFPAFPGTAIAPLGYIVRVRRRNSGGGGPVYTHRIQLSTSNVSAGGANKADTGVNWTASTSYEIIAYGAADDLWGNTFTLADLVSGVYVHLTTQGDTDPFGLGTTGRVEHVSMEAYYSEAAAAVDSLVVSGRLISSRVERPWSSGLIRPVIESPSFIARPRKR